MSEPKCMSCDEPMTRVTREKTERGYMFVVYCPCDAWEVPGAKSKEHAVQWWSFGDKKTKPKQGELFG